MFLMFALIGSIPAAHFIIERNAAITNQSCTVQEVVNHYRLKYIQLKMAGGATNVYGNIVTHYLRGNHC